MCAERVCCCCCSPSCVIAREVSGGDRSLGVSTSALQCCVLERSSTGCVALLGSVHSARSRGRPSESLRKRGGARMSAPALARPAEAAPPKHRAVLQRPIAARPGLATAWAGAGVHRVWSASSGGGSAEGVSESGASGVAGSYAVAGARGVVAARSPQLVRVVAAQSIAQTPWGRRSPSAAACRGDGLTRRHGVAAAGSNSFVQL